jgi:hypothetical protein
MKSSPAGRAQFKSMHEGARTIAAEPASSSHVIDRFVVAVRKAIADFAVSYRPEKHYMRGPGPKCGRKPRAKDDA